MTVDIVTVDPENAVVAVDCLTRERLQRQQLLADLEQIPAVSTHLGTTHDRTDRLRCQRCIVEQNLSLGHGSIGLDLEHPGIDVSGTPVVSSVEEEGRTPIPERLDEVNRIDHGRSIATGDRSHLSG